MYIITDIICCLQLFALMLFCTDMTDLGRKLSGVTELDFSLADEAEIFVLLEDGEEKFTNVCSSVEELKEKCLEFVADECQKNQYLRVNPDRKYNF